MKILFSTDTIKRGGKERQLFLLARQLHLKGNDIHIITLEHASNNYIEEYHFNIEKINIIERRKVFKKYISYKNIIACLQPDIVFSFDIQTSAFNLLLYKRFSYIFINGSIQHGIRLFRFSHYLRSFICRISPYVIANSYAGFRANHLRITKKRFVLYNGIENKFKNKLSADKKELLKKKWIAGYRSNPGIVYISVANFVPYKDYFTVLSVLHKLKDLYPFYYIIIGDGPLRNEIETKIEEYGLKKHIILTGRISNVHEYLNIADIMIHSSRGEGVSNAILEGMYAGLPVIATNVGGIPETVYPPSSILFPYKDEEALLDCLLQAPERFAGFDKKSAGYQEHLKKFSIETMVNRFEKIIEQVLKD